MGASVHRAKHIHFTCCAVCFVILFPFEWSRLNGKTQQVRRCDLFMVKQRLKLCFTLRGFV